MIPTADESIMRGRINELEATVGRLMISNADLVEAINDALQLLADTDLHAEDRAANAQMCLAYAIAAAKGQT
jgi:hypothetical protein